MLKCLLTNGRAEMTLYIAQMRESRFRLANETDNEDIWGARGMLGLKLADGKDLLAILVRFIHMERGAERTREDDVDSQKAKIIEIMLEDDGKGKGKEKEQDNERPSSASARVVYVNERFVGAASVTAGFRICMINVLISAVKMLDLADLKVLAEAVVQPVVSSYFSCNPGVQGEQFVRAAHLQVRQLFNHPLFGVLS